MVVCDSGTFQFKSSDKRFLMSSTDLEVEFTNRNNRVFQSPATTSSHTNMSTSFIVFYLVCSYASQQIFLFPGAESEAWTQQGKVCVSRAGGNSGVLCLLIC